MRGRGEFVGLPYYESLANPLSVARAAGRSLTRFWRTLADVDVVWLLGPHPLAVAFALLAAARGKRVVLGVRQDLPAYVRNRRPGRRMMIAAASLLEASFRLLARRFGVVVVGPELARRYAGRGRSFRSRCRWSRAMTSSHPRRPPRVPTRASSG